MNSEPPPSWMEGAMALRLRGLVWRSRPACAHACWKTGALEPPPPPPTQSAAAIDPYLSDGSRRRASVVWFGGGGDGGDWCRIAVVATANAAASPALECAGAGIAGGSEPRRRGCGYGSPIFFFLVFFYSNPSVQNIWHIDFLTRVWPFVLFKKFK